MADIYPNDPGQQSEYNYLTGAGYGGKSQGLIQKQSDAFTQTFTNLMGRAPTDQETSQFFQQQYVGQGHPDLIDPYSAAQAYTTNAFGPQIAKYNQQQQTSQLGTSESQIQDIINKTMGNTASQFSDPNSELYQSFSGQMNNQGISPSSGAFQAGAGSTIASAGLQAANQGLTDVGIPAINNIAGVSNNPYQSALSGPQMYEQQTQDMNNFELQSELAKMLASQGQPSSAQNILGMASGSAQGAGSLLQGASAAKGTSYVCKELIKRGLLCESDMDDFHAHIMSAMLKKGRAFWKYAMDGWKLVDAANRVGVDWKEYKPLLFDRVMAESDAGKAVDLYADACCRLAFYSDASLWDERVYRTSFFDSLIFLPRLLTYRPFLEALWKCVRIKTLFIYDKPQCEVHR